MGCDYTSIDYGLTYINLISSHKNTLLNTVMDFSSRVYRIVYSN